MLSSCIQVLMVVYFSGNFSCRRQIPNRFTDNEGI